MNARKMLCLSICVLLALCGCYSYQEITGSGNLATRVLDYTGFTAVDISADAALTVRYAPTHRVTVTADDNLIDLVTAYASDGGKTLAIGMDPSFRYARLSLAVVVELPTLTAIRQGSNTAHNADPSLAIEDGFVLTSPLELLLPRGRVEIHNLDAAGTDVRISVYDGIELQGTVVCGNLDLEVNGYGNLNLNGSADDLSIGDSYLPNTDADLTVDLSGLAATNVHVDMEHGDTSVNATTLLDGTLEGTAILRYKIYAGLVPDIQGSTKDNLIPFV